MIKRFCPDKIQKYDKSVQTDTEQIAVFKDYYENQIDAMMDREIDVRSALKQAVHKNDMQKNRIDLLDKRLIEMRTQVDIKRQQNDNLELKLQVAVDDMKAKESRYNTLELKLATYQGVVEEKDKLALQRLQELDAKKDELRREQKKSSKFEQAKNAVELKLLKYQQEVLGSSANSINDNDKLQEELD